MLYAWHLHVQSKGCHGACLLHMHTLKQIHSVSRGHFRTERAPCLLSARALSSQREADACLEGRRGSTPSEKDVSPLTSSSSEEQIVWLNLLWARKSQSSEFLARFEQTTLCHSNQFQIPSKSHHPSQRLTAASCTRQDPLSLQRKLIHSSSGRPKLNQGSNVFCFLKQDWSNP